MWHATEKIKCDMQDDEYFESHYGVSQGLLRPKDNAGYYYGGVFLTLLFSKCQKDSLRMVSNFGYC